MSKGQLTNSGEEANVLLEGKQKNRNIQSN